MWSGGKTTQIAVRLKRLGVRRVAQKLRCDLAIHIENPVVEAATALLAVPVLLRAVIQQQLSFPLRGDFIERREDVAPELGGFRVAKEQRW